MLRHPCILTVDQEDLCNGEVSQDVECRGPHLGLPVLGSQWLLGVQLDPKHVTALCVFP